MASSPDEGEIRRVARRVHLRLAPARAIPARTRCACRSTRHMPTGHERAGARARSASAHRRRRLQRDLPVHEPGVRRWRRRHLLDSITSSGPPVPIMMSPKNVSDPVKLAAFMDYWVARPEWIPYVRVAYWQEPQGDFGGEGQPRALGLAGERAHACRRRRPGRHRQRRARRDLAPAPGVPARRRCPTALGSRPAGGPPSRRRTVVVGLRLQPEDRCGQRLRPVDGRAHEQPTSRTARTACPRTATPMHPATPPNDPA